MNQTNKFPGESPEVCLQSALMEAIHQADRSGASTLIDSWASDHGYEHIFIEILEPALLKINEEWGFSEYLTLYPGYIAGKVAEDLLTKNSRLYKTSRSGITRLGERQNYQNARGGEIT